MGGGGNDDRFTERVRHLKTTHYLRLPSFPCSFEPVYTPPMTNLLPHATRRPVISICGSSVSNPEVEAVAEELGRLIVQEGWVLACGGRGGVMEAASRGGQRARQAGAGGLVLGILPGPDRREANPYLDLVIPTGIGLARNSLVVLAADVVMLVSGSTGTLSEAAYAWQYGKPVIALSGTGGWASKLAGETLDDRRTDTVQSAATPAQAVELARLALGS